LKGGKERKKNFVDGGVCVCGVRIGRVGANEFSKKRGGTYIWKLKCMNNACNIG
jgi:hypothetical protein